MARIDKRALTRLEIIQVVTKSFLENGYTETSIKHVCKELDMSPGNVTFYFPTKEHLLCELVELLFGYQANYFDDAKDDPAYAIALETAMLAAMCEYNEIARDVFLAAYTSPMCMDLIRKNDADRAERVFVNYRPDWTEQNFAEAEILVSGIEYGIMMNAGDPVPLEDRIEFAAGNILGIFGVPADIRNKSIDKVLKHDLSSLAERSYSMFKEYTEKENANSLQEILSF